MSMQRGALEATIDAPPGLVRVSTAHLEYFSFIQRMAQVERLRALHQEASAHAHVLRPGSGAKGPLRAIPRAAAALLVGDFNLLPESPEYTRLHAPFADAGTARLYDAWHLLHPGQLHEPTVCVHDRPAVPAVPLTYDYVFISEDLRPRARQIRVVTDIVGPDHQPLLFEFD
jgi:endonuclease/exonuclease/phosphatase family metal-dependent hydrolase